MDPISATVISDAAGKMKQAANTPMIGRSTIETVITKKGTITYEDKFSLRLWEIGAVALVGAAIWYFPQVVNAFSPGAIIDTLGDGLRDLNQSLAGAQPIHQMTPEQRAALQQERPDLWEALQNPVILGWKK